jgi:hypothetical protein
LLWHYDGGKLPMGSKSISCPLCNKKINQLTLLSHYYYTESNALMHVVSQNQPFNYLFATILLFALIAFVARVEKKEIKIIIE